MPDLHRRLDGTFIKGSRVVGYSDKPHRPVGVAYKTQAIKAAIDLHYGYEVVEKIENAKSDAEITRIMKTERKKRLE